MSRGGPGAARAASQTGAARRAWQWPLDLTAYDRAGDLTVAEAAELAFLANRHGRQGHWPHRTALALARLRRPILDALTAVGAGEQARCNVQAILVAEMHRRRRSFWVWDPVEWREILGASIEGFRARYPQAAYLVRTYLMAVVYLLVGLAPEDLRALGRFERVPLARKVFGRALVDEAIRRAIDAVVGWGYSRSHALGQLRARVGEALLASRSPFLEDISADCLAALREREPAPRARPGFLLLSQALHGLGLHDRVLKKGYAPGTRWGHNDPTDGIAPEWLRWCERWRDTSTLSPKSRQAHYLLLLKAGRWVTRELARDHPAAVDPAEWTREVAALYVAAVDRLTIGQWAQTGKTRPARIGKPLSPRAKLHHLDAVRSLFRDGQEWGWWPRRFDPRRSLAGPRSIRALVAADPRVIADDVWAKLLWAGLTLTEADLPVHFEGRHHYPLPLVRALAIVWLFGGLRADEIRRLRVGCVRWQAPVPDVAAAGRAASAGCCAPPGEVPGSATSAVEASGTICLLDVPTNKTGPAFTKPVDRLIGEAIAAWERVRPPQPAAVDPKTSEIVDYLFAYRGRPLSLKYLNHTIIPLLCRRAGVPRDDARGPITSHRARSTIASQLFNAKDPLSLFELQAWLGHRTPLSTQSYARVTPTRLTKAYSDAGYFDRNLRTIDVLIDQDAVRRGAAADGEPWKFYDLGHGYCTYDFFDQCPHRMACAKCAFYRPKGSARAQLLEGKANLLRLQQEIPLLEEERAAVEDGVEAMEKLLARLADLPTPDGGLALRLPDWPGGRGLQLPVSSRASALPVRTDPRSVSAAGDLDRTPQTVARGDLRE